MLEHAHNDRIMNGKDRSVKGIKMINAYQLFKKTIFPCINQLCFIALVFILVFSQARCTNADSNGDLRTLLKNARSAAQRIPPYTYDAETLGYSTSNTDLPNTPKGKGVIQFTKNEDCVDQKTKSFIFLEGVFSPLHEKQSLWNGKRFFFCQELKSRNSPSQITAITSSSPEKMKSILFEQNNGAFLEGRFWHNTYVGDWITVLENESKVLLKDKKELVDGHWCHMIKGYTRHGDYKLWIDPNNGYNIRRASIVIDNNDLAWGKPLKSQHIGKAGKSWVKIVMEVKDVEIEKIGEHYFPLSGTFIRNISYDDGSSWIGKTVVKRRNVQWNPDFKALRAFRIDLPDGTIVLDDDSPGRRYQLLDGKLAPIGR